MPVPWRIDDHRYLGPSLEGSGKLIEESETRVIKHVFLPSMRVVWTVISGGEYLASLDPPFCTCPYFFFNTLRGRRRTCKHLRALERAVYWGEYEVVLGSDDELEILLRGILDDVWISFYKGRKPRHRKPR